jgi:glutamyl-tRNA synthetase
MGWSYGGDQEVFSVDQMVDRFKLEDIHLGGPIFDHTKLNWLNNQYIQRMDDQRFETYMKDQVFCGEYLRQLRPLVLERLERFDQFFDKFAFFFTGGLHYDLAQVVPTGKSKEDVTGMLSALVEKLEELHDWDGDHLKKLLDDHKAALGWKPKDYFMTVRLVVTGRKDSPPLVESVVALGREITRYRVRDCIRQLSHGA